MMFEVGFQRSGQAVGATLTQGFFSIKLAKKKKKKMRREIEKKIKDKKDTKLKGINR